MRLLPPGAYSGGAGASCLSPRSTPANIASMSGANQPGLPRAPQRIRVLPPARSTCALENKRCISSNQFGGRSISSSVNARISFEVTCTARFKANCFPWRGSKTYIRRPSGQSFAKSSTRDRVPSTELLSTTTHSMASFRTPACALRLRKVDSSQVARFQVQITTEIVGFEVSIGSPFQLFACRLIFRPPFAPTRAGCHGERLGRGCVPGATRTSSATGPRA
mmetsp:Transcript_39186/g.92068  ORF Transcript_39186/g.92068 Transcript_39186/m.92068 type:complete len:222 (-) Transcript_39186:3063-3728(-)